jgi:hypothetical protein
MGTQRVIYRAMLLFACAGLDVLLDQLVERKLPILILADRKARKKFEEYVKRDLDKSTNSPKSLTNRKSRETLLREYVARVSTGRLQSLNELRKILEALGLNAQAIFQAQEESLAGALRIRNQIVYKDDSVGARALKYRSRHQRRASDMERYTKAILDLALSVFRVIKVNYIFYSVETAKANLRV